MQSQTDLRSTKSWRHKAAVGCALLVTMLLLLAEWFRSASLDYGPFNDFKEAFIDFILSRSDQSLIVFFLLFWYFIFFRCNRWNKSRNPTMPPPRWKSDLPQLLLAASALWVYIICWRDALPEDLRVGFHLGIDQSTNVLVLLTGLVLYQAFLMLRERLAGVQLRVEESVAVFLVLFLGGTSLLHAQIPHVYKYREAIRWTGLWVNPNTYGALMGTGVVLALGLFSLNTPGSGWGRLWHGLCAVMAAMLGIGLIHCYSRGAWLATLAGFGWLIWNKRPARALHSAILPSSAGLLGVGLMAFWHFHGTQHGLARRVFSAANANDFSWRNRLSAWEGALDMIAGTLMPRRDWNQLQKTYDAFYRPARLQEGLAIQLNDYLTLGATCGLIVLLSFAVYLWFFFHHRTCLPLSSTPPAQCGSQFSRPRDASVICSAGALVLAICFSIDGGMFRLATGSIFWILLALGRESRGTVAPTAGAADAKGVFWISVTAGLLGAGLFLTGLLWATARDPFTRTYFSLATQGADVKGLMILPKHIASCPVVIYLHNHGQTMIGDGDCLRQIAEQNLAVIDWDYNNTNQSSFDEQLLAVRAYIGRQGFLNTNRIAWVGYSLGAQRSLSFLWRHPESAPALLVRIGGGWVNELNEENPGRAGAHSDNAGNFPPANQAALLRDFSKLHVLLVHGSDDEVFPLKDCQKLGTLLASNGIPAELKILPGEKHGLGVKQAMVFRAVAEYCAGFFDSVHPVRVNQPPKNWHHWLPLMLIILFLLIITRKRWLTSFGMPERPLWRPGQLLRLTAWLLLVAGLAETVACLGIPVLKCNVRTIRIARHLLVDKPMVADFDFESARPAWRGQPVGALLENVALSDYNRTLVCWQPEANAYREFVLSPMIRGDEKTFNWRRPLWESFYPRIRQKTSEVSAAETVVQFLRERVSIVPAFAGDLTIEGMWKNELATPEGFEGLYVAALRSVGIPARLSQNGYAEIFAANKWQPAPRPAIQSFLPQT